MSRGSGPSKRNLLDTASVAQGLDGNRLTGNLLSPRSKTIEERFCTMQAPARVAIRLIGPTFLSRTFAPRSAKRLNTIVGDPVRAPFQALPCAMPARPRPRQNPPASRQSQQLEPNGRRVIWRASQC